jgi:hypothetical protein
MRDLVDELESPPALVISACLAPVRDPRASIVDHVHVHDLTAAHDRDGYHCRVGGVLDRVGDQFAGEQFGVQRGGMSVQAVADESSRGRDLPDFRGKRTGFRSATYRVRGRR